MMSQAQNTFDQCEKELTSLLSKDDHFISNLSNFCALLMTHFGYHWIGFYLQEEGKDFLYLGPFQGPLACTKIPVGKGVCGTSFAKGETLNIANVHEFDGHIACSALSNSELVIPVRKEGNVIGVLDIDSIELNHFSESDQARLEKMVSILEATL